MRFISSSRKTRETVPVAIQLAMQGAYGSTDYGGFMAMLVVSIIPIIVFYISSQKYIIKGVIAGVMGGAKDSILPTTKNVILEIANFEPKGIRRTTQRYQSRTEASARYEKGIDIERIDMAYNMTMAMFKELYPEMRETWTLP